MAIEWWNRTGERAMLRSAYNEAIMDFERATGLLRPRRGDEVFASIICSQLYDSTVTPVRILEPTAQRGRQGLSLTLRAIVKFIEFDSHRQKDWITHAECYALKGVIVTLDVWHFELADQLSWRSASTALSRSRFRRHRRP